MEEEYDELPEGFDYVENVPFENRDILTELETTYKGVKFSSGYRDEAYQQDMRRRGYKPAKNSRHKSGDAVDISSFPGMSLSQGAADLRKRYPNARVLYGDKNHLDHVHVAFDGYGNFPAFGGAQRAGVGNPNHALPEGFKYSGNENDPQQATSIEGGQHDIVDGSTYVPIKSLEEAIRREKEEATRFRKSFGSDYYKDSTSENLVDANGKPFSHDYPSAGKHQYDRDTGRLVRAWDEKEFLHIYPSGAYREDEISHLFNVDGFLEEYNINRLEEEEEKALAKNGPSKYGDNLSISAPPEPSWFDRFTRSMSETFSEAGEGVNALILRANREHREEELIRDYASRNNLSEEELEQELARNDRMRANQVKEVRQQRQIRNEGEAHRDPSWTGSIKRGSADFLGAVAGDANPTYVLAPGSSALTRIGAQGLVNAGTDVVVQADELESGITEEYDVARTGVNFLMGAAFQGSSEGVSKLAPRVSQWFDTVGSKNKQNQGSIGDEASLTSLESDLEVLSRFGLDMENFTTPDAIRTAAARVRKSETANQPTNNTPEVIEQPTTGSADVTIEQPTTGAPEVVSRFEEELRNLKPLRDQQDKLTSEFRSTQASGLNEALNQGTGSSAFFDGLSKLKGSADRVEYESLAEKFTQADVDQLSDILRTSDVFGSSSFDRLNAFKGLQKLLGENGAEIPTPSELRLLSKVFEPEVVNGLMKARPMKGRVADALGNALGLPRSLMSTADLSAPFRQGAFLIRRGEFWKSLPDMLKAAASEKGYQNIMDDIASRPNYDRMQESKLGVTDMDGSFAQREEDFMSNWGEKIPVLGKIVRGANRAYTGFLNKLRADTFDTFVSQAAERGNDISENPQALKAVSAYINSATGRGNLPKFLDQYAPALNATLFSPRLISSRLNLLTNPTLYTRLPKGTRREALKDLTGYVATASTVLSLAVAGGLSVSTNPTSSDFLKIKDGNTRYDILGGFSQYLRLTATLLSESRTTLRGDVKSPESESFEDRVKFGLENLVRFSRSKLSPNASYGVDAYEGSNMIGEEFDAVDDAGSRLFPLFLQDLGDMVAEEGPDGVWKALPGLLGVSVSSYPSPSDRFGRVADLAKEEDNPTVTEINRLSETLGENKSLVGYVNKGHLKKFEATQDQVDVYQKVSGENILEAVGELQSSGVWEGLTDDERIKEVKGVTRQARKDAREELFPEHYGEEEGYDELPEGFTIVEPSPQPKEKEQELVIPEEGFDELPEGFEYVD